MRPWMMDQRFPRVLPSLSCLWGGPTQLFGNCLLPTLPVCQRYSVLEQGPAPDQFHPHQTHFRCVHSRLEFLPWDVIIIIKITSKDVLTKMLCSPLSPVLTSLLGHCWWGLGHTFFSLWCLVGVQQLLSESFCFDRLPFSWSFSKTEQVFVCAGYHFWFAGFFGSKSGIYKVKRKLRYSPPCHFLDLKISRWSAFFYLSVF